MAKAKVIRVKAGEDLSPANILRVIEYLKEDKATKKVACNMLGISYNTPRLSSIIEDFIERKEREETLKKRKRGTPVEQAEAVSMIETYFETGSYEQVASQHFRSADLCKRVVEKYGGDFKSISNNYFRPKLLPELSIRETFEEGEIVWAARTNSLAVVRKPCKGGYWVRTVGSRSQNCAHATEELGSLQHLVDLGVNLARIINIMNTVDE